MLGDACMTTSTVSASPEAMISLTAELGTTMTGATVSARLSWTERGHHRLAGAGQEERHESCGQGQKQDRRAQGKEQEATGRATGDNKLKAEGKADQAKAKLKQTGEKIKDAFK